MEKGIAWFVYEYRLELFEPIEIGDSLNFVNFIGDTGDDFIDRHARIQSDRNGLMMEVARARTRWACVSIETGQRIAVPDDWLYDLRDQMADLR